MRLSISPQVLIWSLLGLLLLVASGTGWFVLDTTIPDPYRRAMLLAGAGAVLLFGAIGYLFLRPASAARRRAATEDLVASQALFQELYRNSPVAYLRTTPHGDIISANNAALRLFKVKEHELDNQSALTLLHFPDDGHQQVVTTEITRGVFVNNQEALVTDSTGAEHWVLFSAFPIGGRHERLLTFYDITKQKEVDIAKTEFLSLASHQLRTPLSAIKWNVELLAADTTPPETRPTYLEKITRNVDKMNQLIQDFLDASQLEMGSFASEGSDIEITHWLEKIYEEFTGRITEKQLALEIDYAREPLMIHTDEHLLRNVLSNLISNAVKYTPVKGTVTIGIIADATSITFTITDTGMGIPEAEQAKLFSKFFRASNARQAVTQGTGLGLYIVARAVAELGGTIAVNSQEGVGSSFTVTIPRQHDTK